MSASSSDEETDFDFRDMDNIRVIGRFRPANETEKRDEKINGYKDQPAKVIDIQSVSMSRPAGRGASEKFKSNLDHFFKWDCSQKTVFNEVGRPMVRAVLDGYNSTIFAYGQTGSGKTYTMFGPQKSPDESQIGLVARCVSMLIRQLKKRSMASAGAGNPNEVKEWQLDASMIQIYKESLLDLLDPKKKAKLEIKHNFQTDTPYVKNLKSTGVTTVGDFLLCLTEANKNRIVASHKLNSESSRSHMLLMLVLEQQMADGSVKSSKLNFGDLAGSEDVTKALGDHPDPERLKEAIAINSSLSALTTCISSLSKGKPVSYRSHPLTHILQDSLGGNSKTTMMVNMSPHFMNRAETIRTLRFAQTAKNVKTKAKVNTQLTRAQMTSRISELEGLVARLKARIVELEGMLFENGIDGVIPTDFDQLEKEMMPTTAGMKKMGGGRRKKAKKKGGAASAGGAGPVTSEFAMAVGSAKTAGGGGGGAPVSSKPAALSMDFGTSSATVSKSKLDLSTEVFSLATRSAGMSVSQSPLMIELQKTLDMNQEQAERISTLQSSNVQLETECESLSRQLAEMREQMEETTNMYKSAVKGKDTSEARVMALSEEVSALRKKDDKETKKWEQRLQQQLSRIKREMEDKNELIKQQTQLNLINEQLQTENSFMEKQLDALKESLHRSIAESSALSEDGGPLSSDTLKELERILDGATATSAEASSVSSTSVSLLGGGSDSAILKKRGARKAAVSTPPLPVQSTKLKPAASAGSVVSSKKPSVRGGSDLPDITSDMGPAEVLMSRFAAAEMGDARLTPAQRAQKTAKLMQELSDDIGDLMGRWLEGDKPRSATGVDRDTASATRSQARYRSKALVFQVRQLIGHFNVCHNQLKEAKTSFQSDLKFEMNRKNKEIEKLRKDNQRVLQLQDDLQEKDEQIERLRKELDELKYERELIQSQSDEISTMYENVTSQVEYLERQLTKTRTESSREIASLLAGQKSSSSKKRRGKHASKPSTEPDIMEILSASEDDEDVVGELAEYKTDLASGEVARPSYSGVAGRQSTWRQELGDGERCDVRDDSGLWWTGTVLRTKGELVEVRFDQVGSTEWLAKSSDRIAAFKSRYHVKKGTKKVLKEGYMSKEGKMWRTWRRRYFVLFDNGTMNYYNDKSETSDDNPIGTLNVLGMKGTKTMTYGRGKVPGFEMDTEERVWKFQCDSSEDALEWIRVINLLNDGAYSE